jgi:hypothetical protein
LVGFRPHPDCGQAGVGAKHRLDAIIETARSIIAMNVRIIFSPLADDYITK